jgi:hypothetical protein
MSNNELEELMIHGDKRKKWKYADLLAKVKSLFSKTAKIAIPELFEALKAEKRDWSNLQLELRIVQDLDGIYAATTIHNCRPGSMKDKVQSDRAKKGWETKAAEKTSAQEAKITSDRQKGLESLSKVEEELPVTIEPEEDETIGKGMPLDEWEDKHPEIAPSSFEIIGEVNKSLDRLWKALTSLKYMPTTEDNVRAEYIIPTRQFRKDFIKGSSKIERTYLYNWIEWVQMALGDAAEIIESVDKDK